jgi:hypothetical protein
MKSYNVGKLVCAFSAIAAFSCGGDGTTEENPPIVVDTGDYHHYATNELTLATSTQVATEQSFDLDEDGTVDLGITGFIPTLVDLLGEDVDVNALINEALTTDGSIVLLHSVRADDLARDATTQWQIYLGNPLTAPIPADQFTGNGTFSVSANTPTNAKVAGRIGPSSGGNVFQGGPGNVSLALSLGDLGTLNINLIATRIRSTISGDGCSGSLGGALTFTEIETEVYPFAVDALNDYLATADPDTAAQVMTILDTDNDDTIDVQDLKDNRYVGTILEGLQIDLLDAQGDYNPGEDGQVDSIPLAIGFKCVPGKFTATGETGTVIPAP